MNEFSSFIPFLFVPVVVVLVIWAAETQKKRATANLQKLAAQLGLGFEPAAGETGRPCVNGTLRGKTAVFFSYVTSSGKSSTTWVAVTVQAATAGALTFSLEKRGFVTKIEKLFGAHEAVVDDAELPRLGLCRPINRILCALRSSPSCGRN
jgi:hypothetical protein